MYSGKLSFSVAILLACGTIAVSARDCPKACTLEFNQVCASNGKEYRLFDNPCMMDVFNCEHEFLWTRAKSLAPCLADTPAVSADIDDCVRPCTMEYNPICAFDGASYYSFSNLCEMHNAECGTEKHFEVSNLYNCVPHPAVAKFGCDKPCTREYNPVCGFNGEEHKVFSNQCVMNNEHCKDNHIWTQTRMAECSKPVPFASNVECEKPCTFEYVPVCGSNGFTHEVFPNMCSMENAHCKDGKKWVPTTFTECIEFASVEEKSLNCEKPCNKMYKPVCGTDGQQYKTFANECIMENEHCKDSHQWQEASFALCEKEQEIKEDCIKICPRIYAPVCGSDGQTYKVFDNQCLLEKEAECDGHQWKALPFSVCENPIPLEVAPKKDCIKICPRIYAPVCGSDGQTYKVFNNQCLLEKEAECDGHQWKALPFSVCENPIPLAAAPVQTKECIKPCNKMYAPTCGTDGQQYKVFANQCIMENQHCYDNHQWKALPFSVCENPIPLEIAPKKDCIKICPLIYAPVCGSDGQTYKVFDNQCLLEKEAECDGHQWNALPFSVCENPIPLEVAPKKDCIKICPLIYAPVCGSDGQTYKVFDNQCLLEKEAECDGHQWKALPFSVCENPIPLAAAPVQTKECIKPCNKMYAPTCGTDGQQYKVFANQCIMENQHCYDNHQWKALPFSVCENPIPLEVAPKKDCFKICPLIYAPVCGSDGQTYKVFDNQCLLEKETECDGHQWKALPFSVCENPIPLEVAPKKDCNKACPFIYAPVCGSDGQTYKVFDNQCLMDKEMECDGHQWNALPFSVCENPIPLEVAPKKNCPMICPLNYAPICAFNGKIQHIFSNECELEAYNCQNNEHFMATLMTECQANHLEPYPVAEEEEEVFACPDNYDPQCGFDGFSYKVFANECMMNGFNSGHKTAQFSHVELSFCKFLL